MGTFVSDHTISAARDLRGVGPGSHVCGVFASEREQLAMVRAFVATGLSRGACCIYIGERRTFPAIRAALASAGVDVRRETRRGALTFVRQQEIYTPHGRFDPGQTIARLQELLHDAGDRGFRSVYATGDMSWALAGAPGSDRLVEYEACAAPGFDGAMLAGLCQYDRRRFPAEQLRELLRAHPLVASRAGVGPNRDYDPTRAHASSRAAVEAIDETLGATAAGAIMSAPADRPILVLEPHRALREALAAAVEHCGFQAVSAASLADARSRLRAPPALALIGLSAVACSELADHGDAAFLSEVPAIVLTPDDAPALPRHLHNIAAILPKGAAFEEIIRAVSSCSAAATPRGRPS